MRRALLTAAAVGLVAACGAVWNVAPAYALSITSTVLTISPDHAAPGQRVTLTATVTNQGTGGAPEGSVDFGAGVDTSAAVRTVIDGKTASWTVATTAFQVGEYDLVATFTPSNRLLVRASSSLPVHLSVSAVAKHPTSTALTASPDDVRPDTTVTFTATVTQSDGGGGVPTGDVKFSGSANGAPPEILGTATLDATGTAVFRHGGFTAGTHTITATYLGDDGNASSPTTLTLTSTAPATAVDTTISASMTPNPIPAAGSAVLKAHVVQAGTETPPPSGNVVTFFRDNQSFAQAPLDANGDASTVVSGWHAGTYTIRATYVGDELTNPSSVSFPIEVKPGGIVVRAPSPTIAYGDAIPALEPTYDGLSAGDDASSLDTPATCETDADASSDVGTYPVSCTGAADADYAFSYADGTLTIQPATLTVTPRELTMVAGAQIPALTATLTGFAHGEDATSAGVTGEPSCTTDATNESPAGDYVITCSAGTLHAPNYVFAPGTATLTVLPAGKATVTIGAPSATIVYGQPLPDLRPSYDGFVGADDASSLDAEATCSTDATPASGVGSYAVTCSGASGGGYSFAYEAGRLTITPATLTVTPDDTVMTGGGPSPPLTATITGYVNGEDAETAHVTGSPDCSIDVTPETPAGRYGIVCTVGTLHAPNYVFVVAGPGTVTVTAVPTTVDGLVSGPVRGDDGAITLTARLRAGSTPLAGRTLTLTLGGSTCTAVTDGEGVARCTVTTAELGPAPTSASFQGSGPYTASTAADLAVLYAFAPGGAFVVGDDSASGSVTFWSGQWSKRNRLSGGDAPASFSGFAHVPDGVAPGARWTSRPGNSSSPPEGPLPSYMGVLVTSSVSKSGSTISGTIVGIAVVHVDPGYAPNPGHAGTGTVVSTG